MDAAVRRIVRFLRSQEGPTATEYAVLLALIALSVVSALALFGDHMNNLYLAVDATLDVF